jgi:cytochrome c oxidase assembly factor CtaG
MEGVLAILIPIVLGALYWGRVHRLADRGQPTPFIRQLSFAGGLLLIAIITCEPVDHLAEELVFAHMVQHTVLTDEAALLLAIGLTGPVMRPVLALPALRWFRLLVYPAAAIVLWIVVMYAWHSPPLYQAADASPALHLGEHASFIGAGLVMWLALLGPLPKPAWFGNFGRLGYIIAVRFTGMLLANILIWSGSVFYPYYASGERAHGMTALQDQGLAGALMMLESSFLTVVLFGWLFARAAAESEQRQQLIEYASAHGVILTPERAARAVASGRAHELRERLSRSFAADGGG